MVPLIVFALALLLEIDYQMRASVMVVVPDTAPPDTAHALADAPEQIIQ